MPALRAQAISGPLSTGCIAYHIQGFVELGAVPNAGSGLSEKVKTYRPNNDSVDQNLGLDQHPPQLIAEGVLRSARKPPKPVVLCRYCVRIAAHAFASLGVVAGDPHGSYHQSPRCTMAQRSRASAAVMSCPAGKKSKWNTANSTQGGAFS